MSIAPPSLPSARAPSRARAAVAVLFLTNGALLANLLPRYPEIRTELGLANSTYGLVLAAFPTGAILAGLGAGAMIRVVGSARLATLATILTALGLFAAVWSPTAALLALALLIAGASDAIADVAQNAHGLRVQRAYGRSIINSFHAVWSIGAVIGGFMAAGAIALDVPLRVHLGISGVLLAVISVIALRFTLPGKDPGETAGQGGTVDGVEAAGGDADRGRPGTVLAASRGRLMLLIGALVAIAMGGTLVEDSGNSWASLYLGRDLGAPSTVAAGGFIALVGAQFIGRLLADGMVDRFGQRSVTRTGGAIIAVGMGLALAVPSVPGTVAGFALAGFGSATLVPAAMQEADDLPGLRRGTGLTIVSWLMRLGFLASPPLVGLIADAAGLRVGLLVVPLAGLLVVVASGVLSTRRMPARRRTGTPAPSISSPR
ncbi:fucose permease [Brachybacterium sp. P6-10-X1]|uniref:MFS transporter n=1 Tax=Brachybacterium sp. P6-10-X1 TaxID=1903186 RepID=UPI000971B647|nr:MFS transporter [Brachybacterium sp. P6-10-X1]APX33407.1 fucose permease [Brachybacterium sp. P6-10-X1]